MDRRLLSLIYMAYSSDVLENAFAPLNDDDYELAMKRVRELMDLGKSYILYLIVMMNVYDLPLSIINVILFYSV